MELPNHELESTGTDRGFAPISRSLGGVLKELLRRSDLRKRVEAERGEPIGDEEFI